MILTNRWRLISVRGLTPRARNRCGSLPQTFLDYPACDRVTSAAEIPSSEAKANTFDNDPTQLPRQSKYAGSYFCSIVSSAITLNQFLREVQK